MKSLKFSFRLYLFCSLMTLLTAIPHLIFQPHDNSILLGCFNIVLFLGWGWLAFGQYQQIQLAKSLQDEFERTQQLLQSLEEQNKKDK